MLNGITVTNSASFILVFLEGLLSFFSPCVIPLIPVYMGYLAGGGKKHREDGVIEYDRTKVFMHTVFFALGISFAFFILGMSFTALGRFFGGHKMLFTRIGGILIIILGLFQIGFLDFKFLQNEKRIPIRLSNDKMNPVIAFVMGFTFSFAWTPCIGPILSSVLIMASGASTSFTGNMLVLVYTLGFLIPFLLLGLFTTQVLNFLKGKQKLLKYTIKAGGMILILMGIMTFTGWMNGVSGYLNSIGNKQQIIEGIEESQENTGSDSISSEKEFVESDETSQESIQEDTQGGDTDKPTIAAFDFTLMDQYGNTHTLSEYKGKVVFLNFWATWCPPCKKEMPDIEKLYQKYNQNQDDIIFLGVTNPSSAEYPNNNDEEKEVIKAFLEDNGYTFPTLYDETGELLKTYMISAFPTTFLIDKDGNIEGYVPGMMSLDMMENVISQTLQVTE